MFLGFYQKSNRLCTLALIGNQFVRTVQDSKAEIESMERSLRKA